MPVQKQGRMTGQPEHNYNSKSCSRLA